MQEKYLRGLRDVHDGESGDWNFGTSFFMVVASIVLTLILFGIREYYKRKYQVEICPLPNILSRRSQQINDDRAFAQELQRQLNSQNDEIYLEAKRRDRKEWYISYVKPYTMTVKKRDLFCVQEDGSELNFKAKKIQYSELEITENLTTDNNEDNADDSDNNIHVDEDDQNELHLRLPFQCQSGSCRSVDGECAICVERYKEGDQVVWSSLNCSHAFHYECILVWLSKGKKRCPICRDWFVPGARIEDQKRELAQQLQQESNSSSITETETMTDQNHSTNSTVTCSDDELDDGEASSSEFRYANNTNSESGLNSTSPTASALEEGETNESNHDSSIIDDQSPMSC